jgi:hypothetical protein
MRLSPRDSAELVFDSWRAGTAVGTRGTGSRERSVLFRAGEFTIDLLMTGHQRLSAIHGQVICDAGPAPVRDAKVRFGNKTVQTDELGQFSMPVFQDAPRSIDIRIQTPKRRIRCSLDLLN